jgi:hypothetical protein
MWSQMYKHLHVKYRLLSSGFSETWIFPTNFRKILRYQIWWKSVQWEPNCFTRTDRQTHMTKLTVFFAIFYKRLKTKGAFVCDAPCTSERASRFAGPQASPICPSGKGNMLMKISVGCWWNDTDRVKLKYCERNLLQCQFVYDKSKTDWPGIEPGPQRWEANRSSHGTAPKTELTLQLKTQFAPHREHLFCFH